jgi:enoyl-CoA hydratase/carnithine racemase
MVALTRAVGRKHAMEMLLTGQPVKARTTAEWGLVNRVVPDAELVAETRKLAMQIVEASPLIIGIGKRAFYEQIDLDTAKAYDYTKEVMSQNAMAIHIASALQPLHAGGVHIWLAERDRFEPSVSLVEREGARFLRLSSLRQGNR